MCNIPDKQEHKIKCLKLYSQITTRVSISITFYVLYQVNTYLLFVFSYFFYKLLQNYKLIDINILSFI